MARWWFSLQAWQHGGVVHKLANMVSKQAMCTIAFVPFALGIVELIGLATGERYLQGMVATPAYFRLFCYVVEKPLLSIKLQQANITKK